MTHSRDRGLNVANSPRQSGDDRYTAEYETFRDGIPVFPRSTCRWRAELRSSQANRWTGILARLARVVRNQAEVSNWTRIRAAAARFQRQRLPDGHCATPGGNAERALHRHLRHAPPEEPDAGRFHRRRYSQLLASLYHQHDLPDFPPPLRNPRRTSRGALFRHALAGWRADYFFHRHSSRGRTAGSWSRCRGGPWTGGSSRAATAGSRRWCPARGSASRVPTPRSWTWRSA